MAEPVFSVIIPFYNGQDFVGEAVESVLRQTYGRFEIVLVNDGSSSSDASCHLNEIVAGFADRRIRVFHRENHGLSATRNFAIAQASGDLIALLDQDDVWFPDKLAREADVFARHPDAALVFSKLVTFGDRDGEVRPSEMHGDGFIENAYMKLLKWDFIPCATTTFRAAVFARLNGGFDERYSIVEEYDLFLRLAANGLQFYFIDEILGRVRLHAANYTRNFVRLHDECLDLLARTEARGWGERYNRAWNRSVVHAAYARELLARRQWRGLGWLVRSALANPVSFAESGTRFMRHQLIGRTLEGQS